MKEQSKFHKTVSLAGSLGVAFSFIFFASIVAEGQTVTPPAVPDSADSSVRGIAFPVAELGNCASKNECKNYCNQTGHMDACIAFAKSRGLMTEKDATRAEKFTKHVREGSSPGNCNSPASCDTYCGNLSHLDECTTFAEENGFKDEHYEQGKKIQSFLKKGGTTPGSCQTKEECQNYCGDFSHAKECFNFAQKAGIIQKGGKDSASRGRHEPNAEQLEKIMELSQKGETPGGCNSKDECEKYCSDTSHREECIDFGVKIGFIKPDEAKRVKEIGGKGPGGCDSQESCQEYCNDENRHEECFKFAEEHGFMTHEESKNAKEGLVRVRQGFEDAPPEVRECLKTMIGLNVIGDIQSGKLLPSTDIAGQVRGCFEKFGENTRLQHKDDGAYQMMGQKGGQRGMTGISDENSGEEPKRAIPKHEFEDGRNLQREPASLLQAIGLSNLPPEALACIRAALGEGGFQKLKTASASSEIVGIVKSCIEKTAEMRGGREEKGAYPSQQNFDGVKILNPESTGTPPPAPVPVPQPAAQIQPTSTPPQVSFLEKFIGAALLPVRWMLGK